MAAAKTIAIVYAYDDPNAASDLNAFSSTFGLPTFNAGAGSPTFQKLNQDGQTSPLPSTDLYGPFQSTGFNDWEQETRPESAVPQLRHPAHLWRDARRVAPP